MYPFHKVSLRSHICTEGIGIGLHLLHSAALESDSDRSRDSLVIHLFETDLRLRKPVLVSCPVFGKHLFCLLGSPGVDYELGKICPGLLGDICGMETRRSRPDKSGHRLHPLIRKQDALERIAHRLCPVQPGACIQIYLHGKTVPFRHRHHLDVQLQEHQHSEAHGHNPGQYSNIRVTEAYGLHPVVSCLQQIEEPVLYPDKTAVARGPRRPDIFHLK